MLDTFLLALYASMVPVVYLQYNWLQDWINVYHYGAVAAFVWVSAAAAGHAMQAATQVTCTFMVNSLYVAQQSRQQANPWGILFGIRAILQCTEQTCQCLAT